MADQDADEEAQRLEELRRIKRATLHELDKQAAQYTASMVPPHIQTERQRLRRELGIVDLVIASPLNGEIGEDLGEASRFVAYLEQLYKVERSTLKAVAQVETHVNAGLDKLSKELASLAAHLHTVDTQSQARHHQSEQSSMQWRRLGTWAFILIIIIIVAMALVGMFWLGRLSDGQAVVRDLIGR